MKHTLVLSLLLMFTLACSNAMTQKDNAEKTADAAGQPVQGKQGNGEDISPKFKSEKDKALLLASHCEKVKQTPDDYSEEDRILCSKE